MSERTTGPVTESVVDPAGATPESSGSPAPGSEANTAPGVPAADGGARAESAAAPVDAIAPGRGPAVVRVVRDQRKTVFVALVLAVASYWIAGQLGEWRLATSLAIGVGLGLLNHLATEWWLLRIVSGGHTPSRGEMVRATLVRLTVLAVVAVAVAALLWPDGVAVLIGLAIFRLIALVMTSLTLLRDLKEELKEQ